MQLRQRPQMEALPRHRTGPVKGTTCPEVSCSEFASTSRLLAGTCRYRTAVLGVLLNNDRT